MPHVNLHAIAINEQRQPFEPSLWRRSKFKHFNTAVEQVWFPDAHADIEDKTAGGIIIPDSAKEKPSKGEITAVGPGDRDEAGSVLFGKWSGTEVKLDGQELLIMKESDIMGVLHDGNTVALLL